MNTSPFRANFEIKDPQLLFGRKEELKKLCDFAEGLLQVEIIGARRFGKTCLLKSFITLQKENINRKAYPVYIDIYSDGIAGTTNVYRYLTSQLVANLLTVMLNTDRHLSFLLCHQNKYQYKQDRPCDLCSLFAA